MTVHSRCTRSVRSKPQLESPWCMQPSGSQGQQVIPGVISEGSRADRKDGQPRRQRS
jgi:hypothetical protein